MVRVLIISVILFGALLASSAPLSFIVLDTQSVPPGRLPDGWQLKVNRGAPEVSVIREQPRGTVLHLKSNRASFGLERSVDIDPSEYPYLSWNWKVTQLPNGGDFRHSSSDDQAAQVLVLFSDRRVLSYLWDSSAPAGLMQSASSVPLLHIFAVVCRSGPAELNQWLSESRNLVADYQKAYGKKPVHVKGIRLQINSQHTASLAESNFGEVVFRSTPQ